MSDDLGVDVSCIFRWEKGDRFPQGENLTRYAELLERLRQEIA